jgi:hypothetical protein
MKLQQIKVGKWYRTAQGSGEALRIGGPKPSCVWIRIERPWPRGERSFKPREVFCEVMPGTT